MTLPKPTYKRGNVILVLFPHTDLRTAKLRPALVVQADGLGTGLPQLIIAMITSRMFRSNHPSRVTIQLTSDEGQRSGLLTDSVVMTDNLATVAESEIDRIIGLLPMGEVDRALRHTLGLKRGGQK
jgi:mRNA interferase MazF